ncbi:MAG: CHAT domain-containing protein, partial [Ktedonobacteraceae bacterium]
MELIVTRQAGLETEVTVLCDNQHSHIFDLRPLLLKKEKDREELLNDPVTYGKQLYAALFPSETLARRALASTPERILLVTTDPDLDAVPWEYAYGPDGFLVLECHFVRSLPAEHRIDSPTSDSRLYIVAVPSNPLDNEIPPLNIEGEWMRLKEIIQEVSYAITLERSRPPTIEQVGDLLANQRHRVVHFMGHGGQDERGAVLLFEKNNGDLDTITAEEFLLRVRESTFLITLNACVSATPGPTLFSNLAAALARQKIPYALGMRFSISDRDARVFSRVFYSDLARGSSVEEALLQARLTLANSPHAWVVGVPVLYTALARPAAGFTAIPGIPSIIEHQPRIELSALPYTEGILHGRIQELKWLGNMLTGSSRPPLVTIHGPGGQGKTTLAREVAERFAHAWPGGVWATSLENLPSRELFVNDLARFLGIITLEEVDSLRERQVLARLAERQTLIVLDNAETLVDAVESGDEAALHLAQFIREQLSRPPISFLATSRSYLGWGSEIGLELRGLAPQEGAMLFQEHASRRRNELKPAMVWSLSEKVEGHPLSLCLLGSAFNSTALSFSEFVGEYDRYLLAAENKYKDVTHRHRTIYASIEASVDYLSADLYALFSCLWVFHAPFVPEVAAAIVAPETKGKDRDYQDSPVLDQLHTLWQRGLLTATVRDNIVWLYHLLPTIRHYIERYVKQTQRSDILLTRFGEAYAKLAPYYVEELNNSPILADAFQQSRRDFERAEAYVPEVARGDYSLCLGRIMQRLGDSRRGLLLTEQALEIAQGRDHRLERRASYFLAAIYQMMGQPNQALALFERTKLMALEAGDRQIEASALSNLISLYHTSGDSQRALKLAEQALPVIRELHERQGEAMTINHIAAIYQDIGQLQQALALFKQALLIQRELGDRDGETLT